MTSALTAELFSAYAPAGRAYAVEQLQLINAMPLPLAIALLRELYSYDWLFAAEQSTVTKQFSWLNGLPSQDRSKAFALFSGVSVQPAFADQDWARHPREASEVMAAYLWSTHQMDAFRKAANTYTNMWQQAMPEPDPSKPRLCVVVLDASLQSNRRPVFRKLRQSGVFFSSVFSDGFALQKHVSLRAAQNPSPDGHWFVDASEIHEGPSIRGATLISWPELSRPRRAVLGFMQKIMQTPGAGPELLRTSLAEMQPAQADIRCPDERLARFQLSLLTEGSGTQIYSTTFAQWAAREILRRAEPSTLIVRFGARQKQYPMDELIRGVSKPVTDAEGSFADADMGAFYTWINHQRLPGSRDSHFVAWSQADAAAIVIGPGYPANTSSATRVCLDQLLS